MTPLERARDVVLRHHTGDADDTPPLLNLIVVAIESAEKETAEKMLAQPGDDQSGGVHAITPTRTVSSR